MHRRTFLQTSALAASALSTWNFSVRAQDKAGKKLRVVLIGCGWWGNNILREAMASGRCEVVGLCDVDQRQIEPTLAAVTEGTGDKPKVAGDYRELLEQTRPDIAIVGTPDHWHALQTIAAVKAGAHVYVEKPISHTIMEGRAMVAAAKAAGKVVQVGTHRRISPHNVSGREFIRSGKAGDIASVRCFVHYGGGTEKPIKTQPVPKELDWEMWCGPAPLRPYNGGDPRDKAQAWRGAIHPRGFRSYLDYANGQLGDWGIHWLDQVLWITDQKAPRTVYSTGGRDIAGAPILTPEEQTSDAPDHQVAVFDFPGLTVHWEHRKFAGNNAEKGENVGCYFYGSKGTFHMGWQKGWTFYPANDKEAPIHEAAKLNEPDGQNIKELWSDFLGAIDTGAKPVCDIADIHLSTNCALLGMLSYKLGRSISWDAGQELCVDDAEANKLLRREYRKGWEYPAV